MKKGSKKSGLRIWLGTLAVAFMLVAVCPQSAEAQTNTFPTTGNAGAGTTTPGSPLEVKAAQPDIAINQTDTSLYSRLIFKENGGARSAFHFIGSAFATVNRRNAIELYNNYGAILFFTDSTGTGVERMRIDTSGNVGIGIQSPGVHAKFEVNGAGAPDYAIFSDWLTSTLRIGRSGTTLQLRTDAGQHLALMSGAKVGIGTTSPIYSLDVNGGTNSFRAKASTTSSSDAIAAFENSTGIQALFRANGYLGMGTTSPLGRIDVRQIGNSGTLSTLLTSYGGNEDTYLRGGSSSAVVHIGDVAATTSKLLLMENGGNVGIGMTSPTEKLEVSGNLKVSGTITGGTINAKYQDVAEWVESSQALAAGTVVVLDHTRSNQVVASSKSYDTRVAGVISVQPGIALGESGAGKVLVATTGRVKIKVDASSGAIQIGDLLVTSDKEGVAKKSDPLMLGGVQIHRPGTLIGKALEPLANGTGEILVLLSLQ